MHSATATLNGTETLSETETPSATETHSGTGTLNPDRARQESIKSQTVMEDRVVSGTSDSAG